MKDRVANVEAQVQQLNDEMNIIRVLLDGNKTITDYSINGDTYTLTLSNGETLTLTPGVTGGNYPSIEIGANGNWFIGGTDTGWRAQAENGEDATITPEFKIAPNPADGDKKYWYVKSNLPESLGKLEEIAQNLWWVWNSDAKNMFRTIDAEAWKEAHSNPIQLLNILSYEKLVALGNDKDFVKKLNGIYDRFKEYINTPLRADRPSVAYFSMEYGLTEVLKIYSGGLGVLAGDYLKEASDCAINMTAVGFLYRYGYFTQSLSIDGQQVPVYEAQNFNSLPIKQVMDENDNPVVVEVPYPGRLVYAYLWKVSVGRISLYLLDTDNDMNSEFDRPITHQLYGGDWETV